MGSESRCPCEFSGRGIVSNSLSHNRDYWHVPDQYTLVRTQAKVYFPSELYDALEDSLISYGESRLGCRAISPIWMSYYVDGCSQVWK